MLHRMKVWWERALGRSKTYTAFRSSMTKGLHLTGQERRDHVASMTRAVQDPDVEKVHAWIHTNLVILDSKAQAILALYSLALTALTVFYGLIGDRAPVGMLAVFVLAFITVCWSIVPLARICFVYWSTSEEFDDPSWMLEELLRVRDERTLIVRKAVTRGLLTMVLFGIILAWDVARRV